MLTIHEVYGRVEVDREALYSGGDFVRSRIHNSRDILDTDYITVGKVALEDQGNYVPKDRPSTAIADHLPLAYSVATQFYGEKWEWEELVQVAALGLCEAAERHDNTRNNTFGTFAKHYVIGYVKNYMNPERNGSMNTSLQLLSSDTEDLGVDTAEENNAKTVLYGAVEKLTPKQKFVIEMVYFEGYTQEQVANVLDITQEGVAKLVARATVALRKQLGGVYH